MGEGDERCESANERCRRRRAVASADEVFVRRGLESGRPPSVLAWGRRLRVWEATVSSEKANESTVAVVGNGQAKTTEKKEIQTCEIVLFAPRGQATILTGMWARGRVESWGHPLRVRIPSGSGNACVAHDGTIHNVGPFTASSRCPRTA